MGLAVEVGIFADAIEDPEWAADLREGFREVSEVMVESGLAPHAEPEDVVRLTSRADCPSFPYSYLHFLRRAYAHAKRDPAFRASPLPEDEDPAEDPILLEEYERVESHLLCHSDAEGDYIPQPFEAVVLAVEDRVPGGAIGSSQTLLAEWIQVAPALGVHLDGTELSDVEAARVNRLALDEQGLGRELMVWLALYEAARLSVESGAAIVFC